MGNDMMETYNREGGIVVGSLEIILGVLTFAFHIPQFTAGVDTAILLTGMWAGLAYIIIGIITLFAGTRRTLQLVKASLGLSILGFLLSIIAIVVTFLSWALTAFQTFSSREEREISDASHIVILVLSGLMWIPLIAGTALAGLGLRCCCSDQSSHNDKDDNADL